MPQSVELTYGAQDKDPEGDVEWESQSNGWISTGGGLDLAWIELDNKGKRVPRVFYMFWRIMRQKKCFFYYDCRSLSYIIPHLLGFLEWGKMK